MADFEPDLKKGFIYSRLHTNGHKRVRKKIRERVFILLKIGSHMRPSNFRRCKNRVALILADDGFNNQTDPFETSIGLTVLLNTH